MFIIYEKINKYSILLYSILLYSIVFYSIVLYSILFYSILFYSILFFLERVLGSLGLNLQLKAKVYESMTLAALFLLNNHHYILKTLQRYSIVLTSGRPDPWLFPGQGAPFLGGSALLHKHKILSQIFLKNPQSIKHGIWGQCTCPLDPVFCNNTSCYNQGQSCWDKLLNFAIF